MPGYLRYTPTLGVRCIPMGPLSPGLLVSCFTGSPFRPGRRPQVEKPGACGLRSAMRWVDSGRGGKGEVVRCSLHTGWGKEGVGLGADVEQGEGQLSCCGTVLFGSRIVRPLSLFFFPFVFLLFLLPENGSPPRPLSEAQRSSGRGRSGSHGGTWPRLSRSCVSCVREGEAAARSYSPREARGRASRSLASAFRACSAAAARALALGCGPLLAEERGAAAFSSVQLSSGPTARAR